MSEHSAYLFDSGKISLSSPAMSLEDPEMWRAISSQAVARIDEALATLQTRQEYFENSIGLLRMARHLFGMTDVVIAEKLDIKWGDDMLEGARQVEVMLETLALAMKSEAN